ncbi:MAG: nickel pincer cofactor biosynthesis protein LarC [Candidatus Margulisbacteria bacterium]|nr:nickel pincer cofactor biosynthesis protein LarC [Candidatus Margulisiibacteriota bacterium]
MRIAYFDAPSGLSGNMILGALIDAGLDESYLRKELLKLPTSNFKPQNKYQLITTKTKKQGLAGTYFNVFVKKEDKHRSLANILLIIKKSKLSRSVKSKSSTIFKRLAAAEAKVHGISVNKVHFHEVGAIDAIIDIVGACIGFEKLEIEKVYCSPLPNGKGKIVHAHGLLPNPAPAAAELLKGVPTYSAGIKGELVTPTGAAIITTVAESFGDLPRLKVEEIGYGAGSIDLPIPNLLRVFIGEAELPTEHDAILQIETNIDDMEPKRYDRAIAKIMKAGALDASVQPIRMKKQREAVKLEVQCRPEDKGKILNAVFTETTTIGTRIFLVKREKLRREIRQGKKISYLGSEIKRVKPEF